jgi:hypothetical protein
MTAASGYQKRRSKIMAAKRSQLRKKYFTVAEANASLPLIRAIVGDITRLAHDLQDRHDRLKRMVTPRTGVLSQAHQEELRQIQEQLERDQEQMAEYIRELGKLGVELKDFHTGLIDFPCWKDEREVYLCWRLGEPEVAHWHELDAGFAGRQTLWVNAGQG